MLGVTRKEFTYGKPLFITVLEVDYGGFHLDTTNLVPGSILPGGTVMGFDEATRIARPLLSAQIHANAAADATTYQVKKNHNLYQGAKVTLEEGGKSYTITGINKTNPDYDVITVGTSLGAATAGDALMESSASGATAGALVIEPKGLSYEDYEVPSVDTEVQQVSMVIKGTVFHRRIPRVSPDVQALLPHIVFSEAR